MLQSVPVMAENELPIMPVTNYKYKIVLPNGYSANEYGKITTDLGYNSSISTITSTTTKTRNGDGKMLFHVQLAQGKAVSFTDCNGDSYGGFSEVSEDGLWTITIPYVSKAPKNSEGTVEIHINFEDQKKRIHIMRIQPGFGTHQAM